jgi:hypothetical protein
MIALPVLAWVHFGAVLPPWYPLAMFVAVILGGFLLNNGAKLCTGWRDPKLIARAFIKIVLAVLVLRVSPAARAFDLVNVLFWLLAWWLLVTGITKAFLVLRGIPPLPPPPLLEPVPEGAKFANPNDAAKGLNQ